MSVATTANFFPYSVSPEVGLSSSTSESTSASAPSAATYYHHYQNHRHPGAAVTCRQPAAAAAAVTATGDTGLAAAVTRYQPLFLSNDSCQLRSIQLSSVPSAVSSHTTTVEISPTLSSPTPPGGSSSNYDSKSSLTPHTYPNHQLTLRPQELGFQNTTDYNDEDDVTLVTGSTRGDTSSRGNMYGSTAAAASGLLAYPAARVAALTAATSDYSSYSAAAAAGQPYVPTFDSSAFYSPLSSDAGDTWRSLSQSTACPGWPYDPAGMSGYPYGPSYGGLDVRRKNATRESTSTLKAWLYEHIKNPYPTKGEKIMLAIITKMTLTQVSTWFANARRRLKKENKMQWSPRNRTDNDDDDKSSSDEQDDYTTESGIGKSKCDIMGSGSSSASRQIAKDDDEDIIVDNSGDDLRQHHGNSSLDCVTASSNGVNSNSNSSDMIHRRLSSCSRLHQSTGLLHASSTSAIDYRSSIETTQSRLHPSGNGNGGTVDLCGAPVAPHHQSTVGGVGYMSNTCLQGPTTASSSFYYRPTTAADALGSYFRSAGLQHHVNSVSGQPSDGDVDDNEADDRALASSSSEEEDRDKPRIWSIADVATSCRPLQQQSQLARGGIHGSSSLAASSVSHNGFLHPWSAAAAPTPASAYTAHYSAASAASTGISVNGFYQHQHHQQQQHYQGSVGLNQQRHVTGPITNELHQSPGRSHPLQVPAAMATPAGASFLQQQQSMQYNPMGAVGTSGSAFDSVTGNDNLSGLSASVQCGVPPGSVFPAVMTSSGSDVDQYSVNSASTVSGAAIIDTHTAFKPVVKRL